jgi:hypothetical protein
MYKLPTEGKIRKRCELDVIIHISRRRCHRKNEKSRGGLAK